MQQNQMVLYDGPNSQTCLQTFQFITDASTVVHYCESSDPENQQAESGKLENFVTQFFFFATAKECHVTDILYLLKHI